MQEQYCRTAAVADIMDGCILGLGTSPQRRGGRCHGPGKIVGKSTGYGFLTGHIRTRIKKQAIEYENKEGMVSSILSGSDK